MDALDSFLSHITTYRLARNGLGFLAFISIIGAFFGLLPYTAFQLTVSLMVLLIAARLMNSVCALYTKAIPTPESAYITALILFFILAPLQSAHDGLVLALLAAVAMLSKYLIAPYRRHIFNPAAFALFLACLWASGYVVWWATTPVLLPFIFVVGLLFARKLRRFDVLCSFFIVAAAILVARHALSGAWGGGLFFGAILLMDPQTMPTSLGNRIAYGILVGVLYAFPFSGVPPLIVPALALLAGNLFAYVADFRKRITFEFARSVSLTREVYEFAFLPRTPFAFTPGHSLEWSLAHKRSDGKGIRRHLALASAPEDPFVRITVCIPVESDSFERALRDLSKGVLLTATSVGGQISLPANPDQKIGLIADGTGIAPFMSIFRHLAERHEHRDMVLIYNAESPRDFAYQDEIESFKESIGLSVLYLPRDFSELSGWEGRSGFISSELLREVAPDIKERCWFVSGPMETVKSSRRFLNALGVAGSSIKQHEI